MVSITLSINEETRRLMRKFPEMNWSGVVRRALEAKVEELEKMESVKKILAKEQDVSEWAVKLQRQSRAGRLESLKRKGLL